MPGFNLNPLGGGYSAAGPSTTLETRRAHRWVFEVIGRGNGQFSDAELLVLKSASRPKFKFEEPEMHHNQEVSRFAGKQDWEPITLVWYDVEQLPDVARGIYHWIETVVNMRSIAVAHPSNYKKVASLLMLDGTGRTTERWQLYGAWPTSFDGKELDYTSTEISQYEVTMRYDRAVRDCIGANGFGSITPSCPQV